MTGSFATSSSTGPITRVEIGEQPGRIVVAMDDLQEPRVLHNETYPSSSTSLTGLSFARAEENRVPEKSRVTRGPSRSLQKTIVNGD
jgi:hypothetical protein